MTTTQDASIGIVNEATYGTGVVVTRFLEFVSETFDFNKNIKQGAGLRVGSRVARTNRRVIPTADGGGDLVVEALSKGQGLLWAACLGAGASTLVSGTTYQQVFTLGDNPTSLTIQKGVPRIATDNTFAVDAFTFTGCMVDSWELTFNNADLLQLKATVDAKDVTTATGYASPSYSTGANLFHFGGGTISTGALTSPTTTVLGAGATPLTGVRGGSIALGNNVKDDRYNLGNAGRKVKPTEGLRAITGKLDVENDSIAFRDAVLNDTPMNLVLTWTGGALSTGVETLQVIVPEIKFDSEIVKVGGPDLAMQSMSFVGLDNLTAAQPIWVVTRTADAAL